MSLGAHYEDYIRASIAGGRYSNVSEMIRAALRHLEEDEMRLGAFCAAIDAGDASPDVAGFDEESFIGEMKASWRKEGKGGDDA